MNTTGPIPALWRQFALWSALLMCASGGPAQADGLPLLPEAQHADWVAVGRLNVAGYRSRSACTGTLIAPTLVLTAAHCVTGFDRSAHAPGNVHFVAGWLRGTHVWHSPALTVTVHPDYATARGAEQLTTDLAVVALAQSAPPDLVAPISFSAPLAGADQTLGILGYQRSRAAMLSARFDCPIVGAQGAARLLDCPVLPGLSGSPVLSNTAEGWRVTAVVIARTQRSGRAMAIVTTPDDWLLDQLSVQAGD